MRIFIIPYSIATILIFGAAAYAGSASRQAVVTLSSPLVITFAGIFADCSWAPGRKVMALTTTGGNGKPVLYKFTGIIPTDLVISGSLIIIGPKGIDPKNCNTVENITVEATQ